MNLNQVLFFYQFNVKAREFSKTMGDIFNVVEEKNIENDFEFDGTVQFEERLPDFVSHEVKPL